jgi:hypothetical protein
MHARPACVKSEGSSCQYVGAMASAPEGEDKSSASARAADFSPRIESIPASAAACSSLLLPTLTNPLPSQTPLLLSNPAKLSIRSRYVRMNDQAKARVVNMLVQWRARQSAALIGYVWR